MTLKMLLTAAVLTLAMPALAEEEPKPRFGGQIVEAGAFHVEIVARENAVNVYLADHDNKAVAAKGYKGLAILAVGGKSERIVLEPSADAQLLSGKAAGSLPPKLKGVVQITPPAGKVVSAKFE
jgi:hypothetical protein